MIKRTVKILGWGAGNVDWTPTGSVAEIRAYFDDVEVFSGPVNLHELTPENQDEETAPTLFSFEIDMDSVGTFPMRIHVEGATVRFGYVVANYSDVELGGIRYSSGPNIFADVAEYDDQGIKDSRTNVLIDGVSHSADRLIGKGTWHWHVPPGSTFQHDLIIKRPGLPEDTI